MPPTSPNTKTSGAGRSAQHKRARLQAAIRRLEQGAALRGEERVALAEAYFRLAILPDTETQEAVEYLQKAISQDPFHPKLFFHLGRLLHHNGDYRGAMPEYRQALRLVPDSHRIFAHLALALLELGKGEKEIGRGLLEALQQGDATKLKENVTKLDALIETQNAKREGKPDAQDKHNRPAAAAAKTQGKAAGKDEAKQPATPCRWQGLWRVALVEHLSGPKLVAKQVDKHLATGTQAVSQQGRVAEYATALLFLMLSGETPKAVSRLAETAALKTDDEDPAVRLLHAAIALATIEEGAQFVEQAGREISANRLPPELACVLHYAKYGPDSESNLSAVESLRLLDSYPKAIQAGDCFRELRLAVLDGYARRAWRDEQFAQAKLLWRETIPLDPFRVSVAHNLALLAARTKAFDDYEPAWKRATELRYLHAAAAGDVEMLLEERRVMHLSFAQQSRQHYCSPNNSPDQQPTEEELKAWLADRDALEVWLREWDLYYLNSHLLFRSPVHLLGVPRDASEKTLADARDELLHQIASSLATRHWAGIQTFRQLAEELIAQAFARASETIERARDPFYEKEKSEADALAREAIDRGFLLHRMLGLLAETPSAKNLAVGCAVARRQFALPWKILQPICADRGIIERDLDLVAAFENSFINLVASAQPENKGESEAKAYSASLNECIEILPHRLELAVIKAQFLIKTQRHDDAYATLVAAYPAAQAVENEEQRSELSNNLVTLIDNAALLSLPEHVRNPDSREAAVATIAEGRKALKRFPRACGLRVFLASMLLQLGDAGQIKEANEMLEEGLTLAFTDEQKAEIGEMLGKAQTGAKTAGAMTEIKQLLEGATQRVNQALSELQSGASPGKVKQAREVINGALRDTRKAKDLAARAGLEEAERQAADFIEKLLGAQERLSKA